jgi:lysyl-tRNA synthetase class 2
MTSTHDAWRPTATRPILARRAEALAEVRQFFAARSVMEVDTPIVVNAPVTDVHIHSAEVRFPDAPGRFYLHTSPEFAMKRLLASGSGDIYQICHVVRGLERGRQHNAEFTLIEWYRLGFTLEELMDEVEALARKVLGVVAAPMRSERITYAEAFQRTMNLDPFTAPLEILREAARELGFIPQATRTAGAGQKPTMTPGERDELLDLLMGAKIGPLLGQDALTFVHRYPASQAALARLDPHDPRCALRFELYCQGMELANGFHELASASEQRNRFEQDLAERRRRGLPADKMDESLLAALEAGLPECSGVAVGFDRLMMIAAGAGTIDAVLPFPIERA